MILAVIVTAARLIIKHIFIRTQGTTTTDRERYKVK